MRTILVLFLSIVSTKAFCQIGYVKGHVIYSETSEKFPGVTILLMQQNAVVTGASTDKNGDFVINNVPLGTYNLIIKTVGYRDETVENIVVSPTMPEFNIAFPGPCKYVYTKDRRIKCVGGHTDHIVPIVYGLPDAKLLSKAKNGKIYLGGCQLYECHPEYYCTIHKVEL